MGGPLDADSKRRLQDLVLMPQRWMYLLVWYILSFKKRDNLRKERLRGERTESPSAVSSSNPMRKVYS